MPRIELTEEEHQIILKKRENERFYRSGKIEAYNELEFLLAGLKDGHITTNEFIASFEEKKAKL